MRGNGRSLLVKRCEKEVKEDSKFELDAEELPEYSTHSTCRTLLLSKKACTGNKIEMLI